MLNPFLELANAVVSKCTIISFASFKSKVISKLNMEISANNMRKNIRDD